MSEPLPVQPVTVDYAGQPAALGPPIRHPGMELPTPPEEAWRVVREGLFAAFLSTAFITALTAISEIVFSYRGPLRLALPVLPIAGMLTVGAIAHRQSRRSDRSGWAAGLWLGGWLPLGLHFMYLASIGYGAWVRALF